MPARVYSTRSVLLLGFFVTKTTILYVFLCDIITQLVITDCHIPVNSQMHGGSFERITVRSVKSKVGLHTVVIFCRFSVIMPQMTGTLFS